MATRFYFDADNAPAVTPPAPAAEWEHTSLAIVRKLNSPNAGSAIGGAIYTYDAADDLTNKDALVGQFVSAPLAAQTIAAQTVSLQALMSEGSVATRNLFVAWKIYLIDSSGAAVSGGTILAIRRDGTELSSTGAVQNRSDSATTTEVTASSGDRIVVEIGAGGTPTASASVDGHNPTAYFGETGADGDLPVDDTTGGLTRNPWIEFANTVSFYVFVPSSQLLATHGVRQAAQRAAVR